MISIDDIIFMNKLDGWIRDFFKMSNIYYISTPTLFYSFPEYGEREMFIDCKDERYFLPQSHEYCTSLMSLILKNSLYTMEKCYRNEVNNNCNIKSLEFKQICLCLYGYSIEKGLLFIRKFLEFIIVENLNKKFNIRVISYNYAVNRYGDDAPDLRFGEYFLKKNCINNKYVYSMYIRDVDLKNKNILYKLNKNENFRVVRRELDDINVDIPIDFNVLINIDSQSPNLDYSIKSKFSIIRKNILKNFSNIDYEVLVINSIPIESENILEHNIFTKISKKCGKFVSEHCFTKCDLIINGLEIASLGEKNNDKNLLNNTLEVFSSNGKYNKSLFSLLREHSKYWENNICRTTMGIGYERLIQVLLGKSNIHDCIVLREDIFIKKE